ncbi:radical SAM family heme chaperone HemW [Thalassotalea sp. PLHSN55]|uniref:radical SAM family heme chaperone HemW n=1 Tax=Thalassotalea sp. PLHSN55 TaxID=3435888 RepID=UPI003F84DFA8
MANTQIANSLLQTPPLSLYIHIPWCVQKCPYCDFNSHSLKEKIPEQDYVNALIADLDADIQKFKLQQRPLHSIFIGGGTPSLFSAEAIQSILSQVLARFVHDKDIEITLEANPGTVEAEKFNGFAKAGVTRLSIGVQSFSSDKLIKLGRIHDSEQAKKAAKYAVSSGIKSFNLDLMHGLPKQSVEHALDDLKTAISLKPDHISWYQLTIEPNTAFHSKPPTLPQDEILWDIQDQGMKLLSDAGYQQYEISAYAKSDNKRCQHNLNYWQFGDYLGIGCGAHGKITDINSHSIYRTVKVKHPKGYLDQTRDFVDHLNTVTADELPFEFMMNQLRLQQAFSLDDFEKTTGLTRDVIIEKLKIAEQKELLQANHQAKTWQVSPLGHRYLNDLLELFL